MIVIEQVEKARLVECAWKAKNNNYFRKTTQLWDHQWKVVMS